MIVRSAVYFAFFGILLASFSARAQIMGRIGDSAAPDIYRSASGRIRSAQEVEIMRRINERQQSYARMNALRSQAESIAGSGQTPRQVFEDRMKSARKYLAPSAAYREKYKSLLAQPKTGIVSLFPEKFCRANPKAKVKDCPTAFVYGNARYFSFRSADYVVDRWADLENLNGFFVSNGVDNQGIMVRLGEMELADVSLDSRGVAFLRNFVPSVNPDEISRQYMQIFNEIEADGFHYAKMLPIEAGKTYALRVVAYRRDVELVLDERQKRMVQATPALKALFDPLTGDRRDDVIIAFRVLEKNGLGDVTLIWKELARKNSPEVVSAGK